MNCLGSLFRISAALFAIATASAGQTGFPFQDESLHYTINWPSGLSLGDVTFTAHHTAAGWDLSVSVDAGVPAFNITDRYHSSATLPDLCSTELERDISHAGKKVKERTTFDQKERRAARQTLVPAGGGKSEMDLPECARDALAFSYFARRELGQGRVPPPQKIYFGSEYSVRMDYTGAVTIPIAEKPTVTDHLVVSVKGPKSDFSFEVFYARDAARTPLVLKIPVALGTLSVELVR
jgi:hypothetical protein